MDITNSIILGIVQGITEFLPISSTGHLILVRNWLNMGDENGLLFDAILQLATSLAVLLYFRKDFYFILQKIFSFFTRKKENYSYLYALFYGTLPAVLLGLLLEKMIGGVFRDVRVIFITLILGSLLFFIAEKYAKQNENLNPKKGFLIGLFQSLALLPGMSRSGSTISGGLLLGLRREEATRFSFILSFPIIFGSGLYKLLELLYSENVGSLGTPIIFGSIFSFIFGLLSVHYLLQILKKHTLNVFIVYRLLLAVVVAIVFL